MLIFEGIRIALRALRDNKLRTFLTLLGNIVGTMSVIAVVSLINGIDHYVSEEVAEQGSNVFTVERINFFEAIARNKPLKLSDVEYLRQSVPSSSVVGASIDGSDRIAYRQSHVDNIEIKGRSEEYPFLENAELASGVQLSRLEVQRSRAVAVIGWDVYEHFFAGLDAVGKKIKIGNRHFTVIGVVKDLGTVLGSSRNRFVYIPVTTYLKIYGARRSIEIKVRASDIRLMQQAVDEATMAMRIRHRLRPLEENDFSVTTSQQLISLWKKISQSIFSALIFIVSISLVVGGIVLMNVMLVSVTERTREIGVRKALGARRSNIIWQFIVESITLSLIGGVIGIIIGFTIAAIISLVSPLPYLIAPWSIVVGLVVTFCIGLIFGTYPANRAALLDPVVALHYE
jgi:putative ABC transport system permease protein